MTTLEVLKDVMNFAAQRQRVLATNIANKDTPKFIAQEVFRSGEAGLKSKLNMRKTAASHLSGAQFSEYNIAKDPDATNFKPDGGNVDTVEQSMKMATNQSNYDLALRTYGKLQSMLKAAATSKPG